MRTGITESKVFSRRRQRMVIIPRSRSRIARLDRHPGIVGEGADGLPRGIAVSTSGSNTAQT